MILFPIALKNMWAVVSLSEVEGKLCIQPVVLALEAQFRHVSVHPRGGGQTILKWILRPGFLTHNWKAS